MISISEQAIERAKKENLYLFQVKIDGRKRSPKGAVYEYAGALPLEQAQILNKLMIKWIEEGKI